MGAGDDDHQGANRGEEPPEADAEAMYDTATTMEGPEYDMVTMVSRTRGSVAEEPVYSMATNEEEDGGAEPTYDFADRGQDGEYELASVPRVSLTISEEPLANAESAM